MWARPQHNATVTIRNIAITPEYLILCRTDECCRIGVTRKIIFFYSHDCSVSERNCSPGTGGWRLLPARNWNRRVSEQPDYDNYRYGFLTQINEASENFA
jgi:hypothetical protein